jgi:superfamily II DNA/RNA helicase
MLPAIVHILNTKQSTKKGTPKILVLAPTRELALQIEEHTQKVLFDKLTTLCIYGGASRSGQIQSLKSKIDIVIGTPGRMIDLLDDEKLFLNEVSYLVFDEADRMLDMGFEPQIRQIIAHIPKERQTLMFSATWPREVKRLAGDFLKNPIQITIGSDELTANKRIEQ